MASKVNNKVILSLGLPLDRRHADKGPHFRELKSSIAQQRIFSEARKIIESRAVAVSLPKTPEHNGRITGEGIPTYLFYLDRFITHHHLQIIVATCAWIVFNNNLSVYPNLLTWLFVMDT